MRATWMRPVGEANQSERLVIEQLAQLKLSLKAALTKRDWLSVRRIDRLSAQVVGKLSPNDKSVLKAVVSELAEIKILYQQSIALLEKELSELSNHAY